MGKVVISYDRLPLVDPDPDEHEEGIKGTLTNQPKTEIRIINTNRDDEFVFTNNLLNCLRSYGYDTTNKCCLYEHYDITFEKSMDNPPTRLFTFLREYATVEAEKTKRKQNPQWIPPPQPQMKRYYYVPDNLRKQIKDMVRFLCQIHEKGYATRGFTLKNLVVKDGSVKFWRVEFVELNNESLVRDFGFLAKLLEKEIFKESTIPADMQYFINLIGSEFDFSLDIEQLRSLEQWALNHVAIMISEDRLAFLQDIYQKYQSGTPAIQRKFEKVFLSMGRKDKWASRMDSITMGAIQACYHNHLDNTFIGYVDNPTTSFQIIVSNRSMIKCWRNLAIHLLDVGKDYHAKGSFTPLNMDLMIMATFDKEITTCQRFLHSQDLLQKIKTGKRVAYGVNKKIFVS